MNENSETFGPKLLVIRRDNIGDLVCTTPIFRALREHHPNATICVLANSYNLPALENNPDIDQAFAYLKAKHRPQGKSLIGVYWDRLCLMLRLRRLNFDYVILAGPGFQKRSLGFARMIKPKHIVGFVSIGGEGIKHVDTSMPYQPVPKAAHEVEDTFRLLAAIGINSPPPQMQVVANSAKVTAVRQLLSQKQWPPHRFLLGIHISARKPSQRWPSLHFAALIRQLNKTHNASFLLFWSPGDDKNPMHPGDDAKAQEIMDALRDIPILAYPTHDLGQLIAGLSLCNAVICSDGGAMHLAAGLGKPILCFFGRSESARWHPWGVRYELIQPPSQDVSDISVTEAFAGISKLLEK